MARTPIQSDLIHDESDAADEAARIAPWILRAQLAARPFLGEALVRETAVTGASAWIDPAVVALESLLRDGGAHGARDDLVAELAVALRAGLPPPDDAEIDAHASRFARVLIPSWTELLRRSLGAGVELDLDAQLLPVAQSADPTLVQHWLDALDAFGLRHEEILGIMDALAARAFADSAELELPSALVLTRVEGGAVVRRGPHARDAARTAGILESGAQVRDGASAPSDARDAGSTVPPRGRR